MNDLLAVPTCSNKHPPVNQSETVKDINVVVT